MEKPYDSEIIEKMAARSDLSAAYASAMKWDWLRRQKVEDITKYDLIDDCGFCERRDDEAACHESNCMLYKIQNNIICNDEATFWGKAFKAFEAKDQQAFTSAAHGLWLQIRSIIDDLYKPKPEPKKEVFYHIGQRFVRDDNNYTLTEVGLCEVQMINHKGTSIWASRKKVENPSFITESEFKEICGSCTFTLIEDSK